jgi:hypothetical protein
MYIKQPEQGICNYDECNNNTSFSGVKAGYQQYCSSGCSRRGKPRSIMTKNKISISRKIWLDTPNYQDPNIITNIPNLLKQGCLFKKHAPEY